LRKKKSTSPTKCVETSFRQTGLAKRSLTWEGGGGERKNAVRYSCFAKRDGKEGRDLNYRAFERKRKIRLPPPVGPGGLLWGRGREKEIIARFDLEGEYLVGASPYTFQGLGEFCSWERKSGFGKGTL